MQASPERREAMRRRSTCRKSALRAAPWVSVADRLLERAEGFAATYDLRAADAICLTTALAVMEADSIFVLCDLGHAAVAGGAPGREVTAPADDV